MAGGQISVALTENEKRIILQIAKNNGYVRSGKGSFSTFIKGIIYGEIDISSKRKNQSKYYNNEINKYTVVGLRVSIVSGLRGVLYLISDAITNNKDLDINIVKVSIEDDLYNSSYTYLYFYISINNMSMIYSIVKSIRAIKLKDLRQFNSDDEIYYQLKYKNIITDEIYEKPIASQVDCIFRMNIFVQDKAGIISRIAHIIAKERFLILSLDNYHENDRVMVDITVGYRVKTKKRQDLESNESSEITSKLLEDTSSQVVKNEPKYIQFQNNSFDISNLIQEIEKLNPVVIKIDVVNLPEISQD